MAMVEELRDLRYFVEVAKARSFNVAARRLGVSTATLSKAVARLEKEHGLSLFVRASRSIRLSSEGERLFAETSAPFAALEGSLTALRDKPEHIAGIIHLSTFTVFGRNWLAPLLQDFLALHPKVDLVISFHDGQRGSSREIFDIRITWGESLDKDKVAHVLCDLPMIMVASPAYLAEHGVPQTPEVLEGHDCIDGLAPSGARVRWMFLPRNARDDTEAVTITPHGRIAVMDEQTTVVDLARHGLGLTLIAAREAAIWRERGELVEVMQDYRISTNHPMQGQVVMQYRPRAGLTPAARALVDFLIGKMQSAAAPKDHG